MYDEKQGYNNNNDMAKKKETPEKTFPAIIDGKYECSDGTRYSDMYHARQHENQLSETNKPNSNEKSE